MQKASKDKMACMLHTGETIGMSMGKDECTVSLAIFLRKMQKCGAGVFFVCADFELSLFGL